MNYISTTDLRNKTAKLKDSLKKGESTYLVHRSKIIGVVEPYKDSVKTATLEKLKKVVSLLSTGKHITYEEREKIYREHLKEKYGKGIS